MGDKIEERLEGIGSQLNWGMVQQGQGWRMVGIQIGREQEEGKREEDAGFEKIEDFNVTSNAEEKCAGATMTSAEDFTFDMTLQLGGEERERSWRRHVTLHWQVEGVTAPKYTEKCPCTTLDLVLRLFSVMLVI